MTPRDSPSHYLASVEACLQTYRLDVCLGAGLDEDGMEDAQQNDARADMIPLVVNTMGWTKGLGADINTQVRTLVGPSTVFSFDPLMAPHAYTEAPGILAMPAAVDEPVPTHSLTPAQAPALMLRYTAADFRTLNILSYLHATFAPGATIGAFADAWTACPLPARLPYAVKWATAFDALRLHAPGAEDVVATEIGRVVNGAIVALVECEPSALEPVSSTDTPPPSDCAPEWRYVRGAPPPPPSASRCLGLGLVRAVAPSKQGEPVLAHVVTPLPPTLLGRTRTAVKGVIALPIWGMLDGSGTERETPYLRWGPESGIGGERRRVRRNLMRKGQM
jgi:polynucleotide 5'-hydroxyl-kinase GRC3/NOL9